MAQVFATFDSANKSSNIDLSGGNLIATHNGSPNNFGNVAANMHKTTGKWFFEITLTTLGGQHRFGIANSSWDWTATNAALGNDGNGWVYLRDVPDNLKINSGSTATYGGATLTTGTVIGYAVDVDAGTIEMYRDGVAQGVMYNTGLPSDIYFGANIQVSPGVITANFGATAFAYSVPSGYNAGLYTGSPDGGSHLLSLTGVGL